MEEEYEVESVNIARVAKRSKRVFWEYNVKWKNYGTNENTWEPISSFKGSEDIIDNFWARIDLGGRDIKNMTAFKIGEEFMAKGPPRRKPSQRNLKADDSAPAASGSSEPSKETTRSAKRRRSSPAPTPDEDEKPAKRTRGRVPEPATRPAPERTPREPRRPPTKPTPTRRTTKKRTPSPEVVPDSEDEAEDVAMLVDPEQQPSIETPIQEEAPPSVALNTANEAPTEPMQEDAPPAPGRRGRPAKPKEPLVKMADDFAPLDGAISAKARLQKEASGEKEEAPVAGPSSSPRKSPRKPGPGRSSAGMVGKNTSSLLTFEKGALKTVKGKFTPQAAERQNGTDALNDTLEPTVPPTSDELLKLGGLDSKAAEALEDFDEPEEVPSPADQPPESDPTQESVTLAKNKLFPPGTSITASVSNTVQAVWRRSTIFGPLYDLPLLPHIPFLSVLRRGLGSEAATASTPSDSKPFSLKLDTTVIVPLDLIDVHQSLDTIIKDDGPPGKFFRGTDAMKLLDTVRTGGPSARLRIRDDATEEHKAHFARFRSRLDGGDLFTAMAGPVFLGFTSSETPLMQRLNLPPSLASFADSVFVTKLEIENFTAYVEVLDTADTSRW